MLERLWSGWRSSYIESVSDGPRPECVFCAILDSDLTDEQAYVLWRGERCFAILNAYPYTSGHLMVMPFRHVADLSLVREAERAELWDAVHTAVDAVRSAYRPQGVNVGVNLGSAAGAGVPGHVHVHVVPRWDGDTNFMTTVAETRVLPEPLGTTWARVRAAW